MGDASRRETVVDGHASVFGAADDQHNRAEKEKYLIQEMAALAAKTSELMGHINLMNGLVFQTYVELTDYLSAEH